MHPDLKLTNTILLTALVFLLGFGIPYSMFLVSGTIVKHFTHDLDSVFCFGILLGGAYMAFFIPAFDRFVHWLIAITRGYTY